MKTLNEHVWVVEVKDEGDDTYWPAFVDLSRKESRDLARWMRENENKKTRVRKYVPESKDW